MFSQLKNYGKKQTNIYLKVELQSVGWPWDVSGHLKCRGGEVNPNINCIDTNTDIGIGLILAQ